MSQEAKKEGTQAGKDPERLWGSPRTFDPLRWDRLGHGTQQRILRRMGQLGRLSDRVEQALVSLSRVRKGSAVERAAAVGTICADILQNLVVGSGASAEAETYLNAYRLRSFPVPLLEDWVHSRMLAERMPPTEAIRPPHHISMGKTGRFRPTPGPDYAETPGSSVSPGVYPNGVALFGGETFMQDRATLAKWVLEKAGATDSTDLLQLTVGAENEAGRTARKKDVGALLASHDKSGTASLRALPERARAFSALSGNPTPAEIAARLSPRKLDGAVRPVLLYGPSGTGKTVSAVQAVRAAFPGKRILIVTGAGLALLTQVPAQLGELMDLLGTSALIVDDYVHSDPMLGHLRTFALSGCPVLLTHMTTGLPSLPGLRPERLGGCLRFRGVTADDDLRVILGAKLQLVPENVRAYLLDGAFPAAWVRDILDTLTEDEDLYTGADSAARWQTLLTTLTSQLLIATVDHGKGGRRTGEAIIEKIVESYVTMTDPSRRDADGLQQVLYGGGGGMMFGGLGQVPLSDEETESFRPPAGLRLARKSIEHPSLGSMVRKCAEEMDQGEEEMEMSQGDLRDMGIDADGGFVGAPVLRSE